MEIILNKGDDFNKNLLKKIKQIKKQLKKVIKYNLSEQNVKIDIYETKININYLKYKNLNSINLKLDGYIETKKGKNKEYSVINFVDNKIIIRKVFSIKSNKISSFSDEIIIDSKKIKETINYLNIDKK